ncbi:hypothetical protein PCE1_001625 [Barthelona sp. PCE]
MNPIVLGFGAFFFALTGAGQPLFIDSLTRNGFFNGLVTYMANLIGMAVCYFMPAVDKSSKKPTTIPQRYLLGLAILDLTGQSLCNLGLTIARSSQLFTILYSLCTPMVALMSRFFLKKKISEGQYMGIFMIFLASTLQVVGGNTKTSGEGNIFLGSIVLICGVVLHSSIYPISESILKNKEYHISPAHLSGWLGAYGLIFLTIYQCIFLYPKWDTLIVHEINTHHGSIMLICIIYIILIINNALHSYLFYNCLKELDAVVAGILKALQTVIGFSLSHILFCDECESDDGIDPDCITSIKVLIIILIIFGFLLYSLTSESKKKGEKKSKEYETVENEILLTEQMQEEP